MFMRRRGKTSSCLYKVGREEVKGDSSAHKGERETFRRLVSFVVDEEGRRYYQNDVTSTFQWEKRLATSLVERRRQAPPVSPRGSQLQPLTSIENSILTESDEDFAGSEVEEELSATLQKLTLRLIMPDER